jgi:hypothetical protein
VLLKFAYSENMKFLSLALLVVLCGHAIATSSLTNGGTLGLATTAKLRIAVDNYYSLRWNGQFVNGPVDLPGSYAWEQVKDFTLVPVDQCRYPNILAINATDVGVVAGIIMQLNYGSNVYRMGSSPQILMALASAVSDPNWYNNPYSSPVWSPSSTAGSCPMVPAEIAIKNTYFAAGATWRWVPNCNAINKTIYVKLVVYTRCNCCSDTTA